jgi:hypothetical protein
MRQEIVTANSKPPLVDFDGSVFSISLMNDQELPIMNVVTERRLHRPTGRIIYRHTLNGVPLLTFQLVGVLAERLAGLALIERDLRSSLVWIRKGEQSDLAAQSLEGIKSLNLTNEATELKAFLVAGLIFYAKCFAKSEGRRARLNISDIDGEFRETHELAIALRDNYAAHSGAKKVELAFAFLITMPDETGTDLGIKIEREAPAAVSSKTEQHKLSSLITHVIEKVLIRYNKLNEKLLTKATELPASYWEGKVGTTKSLNVDEWFPKINQSDP